MLTVTFLAAFVIIDAQTQERTREVIPVQVSATPGALVYDVAQIGREAAKREFLEAKNTGSDSAVTHKAYLSSFTIESIAQS